MIIHKYKKIFIHIPKNAGTSINKYFSNEWGDKLSIQADKHATIHEMKNKFPNAYKNYDKFAVVRNPYDRMVSYYFYLKRQALKHIKGYGRSTVNYNIIEFKKWVDEPRQFWYDPLHYLDCQCDWLDDTVKIIKYENLQNDINKLFKKEIVLPVENTTDHDHYSEYYDNYTSNSVYERFKKDFEKYNYEKL